jgi:Chaperone for flagella basal body P-ring formation
MRQVCQFLCCLLTSICISCNAETVFIGLKSDITLDHREIRLGELAEVVSSNPQTVESLSGMVVARLSNLLVPQTIDQAAISNEILAHQTVANLSVIWGSNHSVRVSGRLQPVSLRAAADAGSLYLLQSFPKGVAATISLIEPLDAIEVPPGQLAVVPRFKDIRRIANRFDLPVDIIVDKVSLTTALIRYRLTGGDSLSGGDAMSTKNSRVNDVNDQNTGVRRGQKVQVVYLAGAVQLESEGVALADAIKGEKVSVRLSGSGAQISGRVSQGQVVKVEEPQ